MQTAGVRMAPTVRAALGADGVSRAESIDLTTAGCTECGRPLPPAGPVTVQLARGGGTLHLGYAHLGCAPSRLVELPPQAATAPWPTANDMGLDALVLTTDAGPRAALLAQTPTTRTYTIGPDGAAELRNVFAALLLEQGFGLMMDADEDPPRVGGWRVAARLVPGRHADVEITGPAGLVFYEGTADLNPQWCTAAQGSRWCLLYVESDPVAWPAQPDPAAGLGAMRRAAATGGLVAGRLPLVWDAI